MQCSVRAVDSKGGAQNVRLTLSAVVSTFGEQKVRCAIRAVDSKCGVQYVRWTVRAVFSTCCGQ
jgi:hypothetical protein